MYMNLKLLLKVLSQTTLAIVLGGIYAPESVQANQDLSGETVKIVKPTLLLNISEPAVILSDNSPISISDESENSPAIVVASPESKDFDDQSKSGSISIDKEVDVNSYSSTQTESISIPVAVESSSNKTVNSSVLIPIVPTATEEVMLHKHESNPVVTLDKLDSSNVSKNNYIKKEENLSSQQVKIIDPASKKSKSASSSNQEFLSSVPIPIQYYDPANSPSVESLIAPSLPNINSPEVFFPEASSSFKGYIWPAKGVFTSGYGWRWGRMHKGIDIAAPVGTPIVAVADGQVISAGWNSGGYGNLVKIKHFNGSISLYAHNSKILVRNGEWVKQGQQIAKMGSTGFSTGPHLHFEIHTKGKKAVNPVALLPKR